MARDPLSVGRQRGSVRTAPSPSAGSRSLDQARTSSIGISATSEEDASSAGRNARLYLIGSGVSFFGDMALSLAAGVWVKTLTGSSAAAGLVSVCVYAPSLIGPVAGLIVDRVRRRALLVRLNAIAAVFVLALLAVRSSSEVWLVYMVMTGYGLHLTLTGPAANALFAQMLPEQIRQRVNGWQLGLQESGRLVAPLLGAALFAAVGGGAVAAMDSVTFVVAAFLIARLRVEDTAPLRSVERHLRAEFSAGFGYLWHRRDLRILLLAGIAGMGISGVLVAAQYSLVEAVREPPAFLGIFGGLLGAGSIAASLLSSSVLRRFGEHRVALVGLVDLAMGTLLYATGWLPAALLGSIILGFALPWLFLAVLAITQRETPTRLQGRVSAAVIFALFGPQAPLQALGAWAISEFSYRQLYLVGAGATGATAFWLARNSAYLPKRAKHEC
jgi:MFS-type transporter involved in bile tolerance (Atg22 family)